MQFRQLRNLELSRSYPTTLPLQEVPFRVNSNQVAHHLLVNGQGTMPTKPDVLCTTNCRRKTIIGVCIQGEEEYRKSIATLKNNKAAGIDDILVDQLKDLGPKAHKWLHTILNTCFIENKIPKIWRQSKIIALLKPGKDSAIPKNYRPISLLCHTYKLYERLILNRVSPLLEQHLIKEQAGFRPGKSCTSQLLNLTQHIEDGYQRGMIKIVQFEMESKRKYHNNNSIGIMLFCGGVLSTSLGEINSCPETEPRAKQCMQSRHRMPEATNVEDLYLLDGIAPPDIRRDVCARMEKTKQETNEAHYLYGQNTAERRIKLRNCYCAVWSMLTSLQR